MVDSGAILFTVLLVILEIRHYMNDGNIYHASSGLDRSRAAGLGGLALTIGLEHAARAHRQHRARYRRA